CSRLFSFFSFMSHVSFFISSLSLHDALPISRIGISSFFFLSLYLYSLYLYGSISVVARVLNRSLQRVYFGRCSYYIRFFQRSDTDRKSTRLNSSHVSISYAVFCLKKQKTNQR